ncbi:MAG: circularly permuted type 2 ATP-grasp protein [Cyclobacteriaceae bacterium]
MIESYLIDRAINKAPFVDEMTSGDGKVSPIWSKLARYYANLGPAQMEQYHEDVAKQLRENGVTYNVYGDPEGMNRPWMLDPVPMIFGADDWATIESGLKQRTTLLNEILKDIYGSRSLIKEGLIPLELIYNHPGFLRQVDKIKLYGEQQLIQYSADLARGPDGRMWVLHDRTDAPSGAGYTLENRVAMTRVYPDLIRENQVRKIAKYYQTLKNTLTLLASQNKEDPRIVMLSPGPNNETFFEHAYLSSFMGVTLALGQDLTVSDGYVWLKTIKGLEKVDVVIRRVDDAYCDPMEFRSDSQLGVVGLMESVRQGKVQVINPLGSRVLENPGFMAFLPKLSRRILGEELILPSIATWWCGQPAEMKYVLDNIEHLVIRRIYRDEDFRSVYGASLSAEALANLKAIIKKSPYLFVGQEMIDFSTTPSWVDKKLVARNSVFRSYVVADVEKKTYEVMPGGLSRTSPEKGVFIVSNQSGGISKDTWVLGKSQEPYHLSPRKSEPAQAVVRTVLPSRTGEQLFWLGRYLERSIYNVRFMRIVLNAYNEMDDDIHIKEDNTMSTLLKGLTILTGTRPGFLKKSALKNPENELMALASDMSKVGSLANTLQAFLRNAYTVRDRLSLDTWRILDSITEELSFLRNAKDLNKVYQALDNLVIKVMGFYGLNIDNMTRESTWHLLNAGRFIESAMNSCTVLSAMLTKRFDIDANKTLMEDTLRCNESLVTYRYRYRSNLEISGVLDLLITTEDNPRSIVYLVMKIDEHVKSLPKMEGQLLTKAGKKLLETITKIRLSDVHELALLNEEKQEYSNLKDFLAEIIDLLKEISDIVYEQYFSHTSSKYSVIQTTNIPEI